MAAKSVAALVLAWACADAAWGQTLVDRLRQEGRIVFRSGNCDGGGTEVVTYEQGTWRATVVRSRSGNMYELWIQTSPTYERRFAINGRAASLEEYTGGLQHDAPNYLRDWEAGWLGERQTDCVFKLARSREMRQEYGKTVSQLADVSSAAARSHVPRAGEAVDMEALAERFSAEVRKELNDLEVRAAVVRRESEYFSRQIAIQPRKLADLRARFAEVERELAERRREADGLLLRADRLERLALVVANHAWEPVERQIAALQRASVQALAVFAPPPRGFPAPEMTPLGRNRVERPAQPRYSSAVAAAAPSELIEAGAEAARSVVPPEPARGSFSEKLASTVALKPRFQAALRSLQDVQAELAGKQSEFAAASRETDRLSSQLAQREDALGQARLDLSWSREALQVAQANFEGARRLLAERAIDLLVWDVMRRQVVFPAIEAFLGENGLRDTRRLLNERDIAAYHTAGRAALRARNAPWLGAEKLIALQERSERLSGKWTGWIKDAADVAALASPATIDAVARRVEAGLDKEALAAVRAAGPVNVPPPLDGIASKLLKLPSNRLAGGGG